MIKIITDTSALYTPEEGEALGMTVFPLNITINNQEYLDLVELSSEKMLELVKQGHVPVSSQPAIGVVMEAYEKYKDDDILHICMADGLSGTYQSAVGARQLMKDNENIHVINSQTLCGPQRYLVQKANEMLGNGHTFTEIKQQIEDMIPSIRSFLLPQDFNFLKRGGRLTPLAATLGGFLKIKPILTQTEDGTRLEKFGIGRTFKKAVASIVEEMKKIIRSEDFVIYVSHAGVEKQANEAKEMILSAFPALRVDILELSPAFITQGGPACVAIQWVKRV